MKNLYKQFFSLFLILFVYGISYSQTYITWDRVQDGQIITGTAGTVTVTGTLTPGVTGFRINANNTLNTTNLITTNPNNVFYTDGPANTGISRDLILTFNQPIIVTRYNMHDIDFGGTWDDSFDFLNINFSNFPAPIALSCNVNLNGARPTINGSYLGAASWFCSNPVETFTIDYLTTSGLTHARLGYSIEVLIPPTIDDLCLNSIAPEFPIVGNGINGTWSPNIISTNSVGDLVYTFTPNVGEPIQCPIEMTVHIIDCCQPTLLSSTTITTMIQEERSDWISSSDLITFSDGLVGNGVVYHAENFVELTEGFEAIYSSQFAAYPLGCSNTFVYKNNPKRTKDIIKTEIQVNQGSPKLMNLTPNPFKDIIKISMVDNYLNHVKILSLDGKIIYSKDFDNLQFAEIDLSSLPRGVYIVHALTSYGDNSIEKIIKN